MNPMTITQYKCSECGKLYTDYDKANTCCKNIEEIELPSKITSKEDYVRMVIGIQKLASSSCSYERRRKIKEGEEKCRVYLYNVVQDLIEKMDEELGNREIKIDGTTYELFNARTILENHFADEEYQDYDLVWTINQRRTNNP